MSKILGGMVLMAVGVVSLPAVGVFLDQYGDPGIAPVLAVQLGAMTVLGALVGMVLPGLASGPLRRSLLGAACGIAAGAAGVVEFFWLLRWSGGD